MMYEIYEDLYEAYLEAKAAANEEEDEQSSPLFLIGSGPAQETHGRVYGAKKNLKKFKKTIDRTLKPCYNIDTVKERRQSNASRIHHSRVCLLPL